MAVLSVSTALLTATREEQKCTGKSSLNFRGNFIYVSLLLTVTDAGRRHTEKALLRFRDKNGYSNARHNVTLYLHLLSCLPRQ